MASSSFTTSVTSLQQQHPSDDDDDDDGANNSNNNLTIEERISRRVMERNSWPTYSHPTPLQIVKFFGKQAPQYLSGTIVPTREELDRVFPIQPTDYDLLRRNTKRIQVTWIGHASLLLQMDRMNILTDPVFSDRCSAVQFLGPKRYRRPPFTVKELMENVPIHVVLISHNHYDHLDFASVTEIAHLGKNTTNTHGVKFVVPLGLKAWFKRHVPESSEGNNSVVELDWHETVQVTLSTKKNDDETTEDEGIVSTIKVTGVPMQHWSNRNGFDRDQSLWCGYSILSTASNDEKEEVKFLFPGDTGWFDGLYEIGRRYGPFDMAALPIGAYEPKHFMKSQHIGPEEAVEMMIAIKAKKAVPIHWGTFLLTLEPVMEPRERLLRAVKAAGMEEQVFAPWLIGDTVSI